MTKRPRGAVGALLEEAVAPLAAAHPGVEVHTQLSCGMADERLLRASREASMIVIGHRRKPFLNELVYGPVAPVVVERASCSVAVVPIGLAERSWRPRCRDLAT